MEQNFGKVQDLIGDVVIKRTIPDFLKTQAKKVFFQRFEALNKDIEIESQFTTSYIEEKAPSDDVLTIDTKLIMEKHENIQRMRQNLEEELEFLNRKGSSKIGRIIDSI